MYQLSHIIYSPFSHAYNNIRHFIRRKAQHFIQRQIQQQVLPSVQQYPASHRYSWKLAQLESLRILPRRSRYGCQSFRSLERASLVRQSPPRHSMASRVSGVSMARVIRAVVKVVRVAVLQVVVKVVKVRKVIFSTFKCTPILPQLEKNPLDYR